MAIEWHGQLSYSHSWGRLILALSTSTSCTVLPRQGAGPSLPSAAAGVGQGQFTHYHDTKFSSLDCLWDKGHLLATQATSWKKNGGTAHLSPPSTGDCSTLSGEAPALPSAIADEEQGQHNCSHDPRKPGTALSALSKDYKNPHTRGTCICPISELKDCCLLVETFGD